MFSHQLTSRHWWEGAEGVKEILLNINDNIRAIHESVKYPCRQCDHMATSKSNLYQHKRAVHEWVKYPCKQYDHNTTSRHRLSQHKREFLR